MPSAFVILLFIFSLYEIGPRLGELSLENVWHASNGFRPFTTFKLPLHSPTRTPTRSNVSSDICCKIRHVILDDEIKYKALSYVWGDIRTSHSPS
ncbi:hypothetical protein L207DRAFT_616222 [Hyaloscypha variabilis F]|uniref:Heterokaryon incompatibility domain-containing protein n=1 Tax=Hyaloscypha variabilis (strain UAMH 11265 / GT02V1 / F) TaxID=1149755 RepID=A0A2J6S268_HYAVF|nr:hypothetical protein L207DRAFT_616222 [Hyaloscypha variabilis F]